MNSSALTRKYPMKKPAGHEPAIQRYSSRLPEGVERVTILVFGLQSKEAAPEQRQRFLSTLEHVFSIAGMPLYHDLAQYLDDAGYQNSFAVCYWHDPDAFRQWKTRFDAWWSGLDPTELNCGYWVERFSVPVDYRETIAFKEYLRGLSACPMSKIEPMDESGYWGAARDRFAASAHDSLSPESDTELRVNLRNSHTLGKRIVVSDVPERLCIIRSGVTWQDCGEEQLRSYQKNLQPKLDAGMDYLRKNPEDTGCCSLRQVTCLNGEGAPLKEAYSLGIFLTYQHLEDWAHDHPTHLAIYNRALAERKKYQERLELKTYHEIYVLDDDTGFEYLNCHPRTGLLPYFTNTVIPEGDGVGSS